MKAYYNPESVRQASRAAVREWLAMDRTGLVPVVFEDQQDEYTSGVWPRGRLSELPESAWVVYDRA